MRVICVAPLNAKLGFAQILWFLNQNTVRLQTSPPRSGMACVSTSQRLLGCNQSGASWWQNTEANPVLPLTTGGLWPISPSPNFCLNQKFILSVLASKTDPDYSEASSVTQQVFPHLVDSLWLPAFKQLILQKPNCWSVSFSALNCSKILLRPHLKAHRYTCNFEDYSERQTSAGR